VAEDAVRAAEAAVDELFAGTRGEEREGDADRERS
jgi:hypothetical protein